MKVKMPAFENGQLYLFSNLLFSQAANLKPKSETVEPIKESQPESSAVWIGAVAVSPEDLLTT